MGPSNSQIDRLGERLKHGSSSDQDLRDIDSFRLSFAPAYDEVVRVLESMGQAPSGRPAKSTASIVEKLRRESVQLSQIQDIAGCRIVVESPVQQRKLVQRLQTEFPETVTIDRIATPSHGYRAVHVVVKHRGLPVEIQVRKQLQHTWAQRSEHAADVHDPAIKYGGGSPRLNSCLGRASITIAEFESFEEQVEAADEVIRALIARAEHLRARIERTMPSPTAHELTSAQLELDQLEISFDEAARNRAAAFDSAKLAAEAMLAAMRELVEALLKRDPDST